MPITEGGRFSPDNNIVSPGVFTRENDLSGLSQGIANIGGAIVAPFPKGPGFSPMLIQDVQTLQNTFGVPDGVYYGPYTATQYLQVQGQVTVCRVGALTGYKQKNPLLIYAVPGTWERLSEDADLSQTTYSYFDVGGNVDPSLSLVYNSTSGSITLSADFVANFSGSYLNGQTVDVGTINYVFTSGSYYITSSIQGSGATDEQKLLQALIESTANVSCLSMSLSSAPITASANFDTVGTAFLENATLKVLRAAGGCGAVLYAINGDITGSFGPFTDEFIPSVDISSDPCVSPTTSSLPIVLAVLADTLYDAPDTNYTQQGFSGSVALYYTGSDGTYANSLAYGIQLYSNGHLVGTYNFSLDPSQNNYISSVFGFSGSVGNPETQVAGQKIEAAYLYRFFEDSVNAVRLGKTTVGYNIQIGTNVFSATFETGSFGTKTTEPIIGDLLNFIDPSISSITAGDSQFALGPASTPMINSQQIAPWQGATGNALPQRYPLFQLYTIADGTYTNQLCKVEISNVKPAGTVPGTDWGSFTLNVRDFNDTDKNPIILESYQNLTLDPTDANFVARRIGDYYNYITFEGKVIEFGTYANVSQYIRVAMSGVQYPVSAIPYGFAAYSTPINSNYGRFCPAVMYSMASTYPNSPGKYPSGTVFGDVPVGADSVLQALYPTSSTDVGVAVDTAQYFAPLPYFGSNSSIGMNQPFDLGNTYTEGGIVSGSGISPSATDNTSAKMRKFIVGFQGGFDGQSPSEPINVGSSITPGNTQGLDCADITSPGSIAYNQCISALGNADLFDINLIVTPGIFAQYHPYITNLVIDMCEARGDVFYIMDNVVFPSSNQSTGLVDEAVNEAENYDTSYAATYYPWIKILDTNLNQIIAVPPSVVLPAVYASNDQVAAEWFAPAGLNRGGITQAVQVLDKTTHADRDTLYGGRVNPIASFPGQGIVVWGQKTLQIKDSALNRVNVRRLLIALKKYIASSSQYLVFEQNVAATRNSFLAIVNPYLESVQQRSGLYAFQVKMDNTNNTPDIIDQNILYGQIYIQPTKTAEFIVLDFNIMPTGASFPNS